MAKDFLCQRGSGAADADPYHHRHYYHHRRILSKDPVPHQSQHLAEDHLGADVAVLFSALSSVAVHHLALAHAHAIGRSQAFRRDRKRPQCGRSQRLYRADHRPAAGFVVGRQRQPDRARGQDFPQRHRLLIDPFARLHDSSQRDRGRAHQIHLARRAIGAVHLLRTFQDSGL